MEPQTHQLGSRGRLHRRGMDAAPVRLGAGRRAFGGSQGSGIVLQAAQFRLHSAPRTQAHNWRRRIRRPAPSGGSVWQACTPPPAARRSRCKACRTSKTRQRPQPLYRRAKNCAAMLVALVEALPERGNAPACGTAKRCAATAAAAAGRLARARETGRARRSPLLSRTNRRMPPLGTGVGA